MIYRNGKESVGGGGGVVFSPGLNDQQAKYTDFLLYSWTDFERNFKSQVIWSHQILYLGVLKDSKLSWNSHIDAVTKRTNQTTAFLRRNLSSCTKDVKAQRYKSIGRPHLEYTLTVW